MRSGEPRPATLHLGLPGERLPAFIAVELVGPSRRQISAPGLSFSTPAYDQRKRLLPQIDQWFF